MFAAPQPLGIFLGGVLLLHGVYRYSLRAALEGSCPNCNNPVRTKVAAKPFQCKVCNHRLAVYAMQLADISSPQNATASGAHAVHTVGTVARDQEYVVVSTVKRHKTVEGIVGLIFIGLFIWWMTGGGVQQLSNQVAGNLSQQYDIAARQGNKMDMCIQAGATALGFLQAKDEKSYAHWKSVEKRDCATAGMPTAD